MKHWKIKTIEFEAGARLLLNDFLAKNPTYGKMVDERVDDLLNYPDLMWQSAHLVDGDFGYFVTRNQQLDLAGKVYRARHLALVTHFVFHR